MGDEMGRASQPLTHCLLPGTSSHELSANALLRGAPQEGRSPQYALARLWTPHSQKRRSDLQSSKFPKIGLQALTPVSTSATKTMASVSYMAPRMQYWMNQPDKETPTRIMASPPVTYQSLANRGTRAPEKRMEFCAGLTETRAMMSMMRIHAVSFGAMSRGNLPREVTKVGSLARKGGVFFTCHGVFARRAAHCCSADLEDQRYQ